MEKILKLIKSENREDFYVGLNLLINKTEDFILKFFKTYGSDNDINLDIKVRHHISENDSRYITIGKYQVVAIATVLRLKLKKDSPRNESISVVTKEDYINGNYT